MSGMFGRQPPRFVPTLTDVVPETIATANIVTSDLEVSTELEQDGVAVASDSLIALAQTKDELPPNDLLQEHIMSHLDNVLPERLQAIVRQAVERQSQQLYASMRPQIEELVRDVVCQAVRQEAVVPVSKRVDG